MISTIADNLPSIRALCQKHGVARLFLVGSAVEGEARTDAGSSSGAAGDRHYFDSGRSDFDFLVEFDTSSDDHASWGGRVVALKLELESLLHRPVDVIERGGVRNPVVRASMEASKVPLYAAA